MVEEEVNEVMETRKPKKDMDVGWTHTHGSDDRSRLVLTVSVSVPLEQLMSRCVLREMFNTIRYQIPLRMHWGSHTRLTDKPGDSDAAQRKRTLA